MRFVQIIALVSLSVGQLIFAQKAEIPPSILPTEHIFEKFQNDISFLDSKITEIDTLGNQIKLIFDRQKPYKRDSLAILKHCIAIQNSMTEFTNFNARRLNEIDQLLSKFQPIRGSEMTYLNKSFQVYKRYMNLYGILRKEIKSNKHKIYTTSVLQIRIYQLSAFYKNYYKVIGNQRLRRVINTSDITYNIKDNDLKRIALKNLKRANFRLIKNEVLGNYKSICVLLDTSIYQQIKKTSYKTSRIRQDKKLIKKYFRQDNSYKIGQFFIHHISGFVGNFAGLFRFRKGHLYHNDSISNAIVNKLKPMDLIAEKTGFALTDKMIPGHFGHIAIWLGTEKQLKQLALWDHAVIKPIQARIRAGYTILETDRGGTHLKTLKDFMNVDALAIASIKGFEYLPQADKILLYQNALAQIGKEYDFNFDVETSDKLVCSELLYQVFGSIHWPTDSFLKRNTISPDNVLSLALYQNTPISLSYYIQAEKKNRIRSKTLSDLAIDLGYKKNENIFVRPQTKCIKKRAEGSKRIKKECKTIYHEMIYH